MASNSQMSAMDNLTKDFQRRTLCLSGPEPGVAVHAGDAQFSQLVSKAYNMSESIASEKLIQLKTELKSSDTETFWTKLMEGMADICDAQYGFVAKRILVDDHDSAIEMPPIGEPGSCLMAVALYYNDGKEIKALHRDYKYLAWSAPCAYMRHDKVFLVPEQMSDFITDNPNQLPFSAEGYLGVPFFSNGKCFAHFGMMWTQEALDRRKFSWAYMEMILHALEDVVIERLLTKQSFAKNRQQDMAQTLTPPEPARVIPQDAITAQQTLKPYAKSLSHELRTPMHGVVGMLDIMHATVQEQIEGSANSKTRQIFQALRENIETVQDSSKRAVEAADNVVHAYDLNMQIPETPNHDSDSPATNPPATSYFDFKATKLSEGSSPVISHKRRRSSDTRWEFGNPPKVRHIDDRPDLSPHSKTPPTPALLRPQVPTFSAPLHTPDSIVRTPGEFPFSIARSSVESENFATPGLKQCNIRELVPIIIQDGLRVGGRPDYAVSEPTDDGERMEVRTRSSNGETSQKTIEWSVVPDVPETILVDERELAKLITAVFLNAVKFTEQGKISLIVRMSQNRKYFTITVIDTGDGIPEDFQPELFKPFSQEDSSLTRTKEGLGLGLLVAKGLSRRMGGDLILVRSATSGPHKGSEFEVRVPLEPTALNSRTNTPLTRSPEPSKSVPAAQSMSRKSSTSIINFELKRRLNTSSSPCRKPSPGKENLSSKIPAISKILNKSPIPKSIERRSSATKKTPLQATDAYDRNLASKHPLTFLVAEDNKINRKLLVNMLGKLGYKDVYEAYDGREAVRVMKEVQVHNGRRRSSDASRVRSISKERLKKKVDVVLMDLWMPEMDGYQAAEEIFRMFSPPTKPTVTTRRNSQVGIAVSNSVMAAAGPPVILAVSADATDEAIARADQAGMGGYMTKPYRIPDLQKLILETCVG